MHERSYNEAGEKYGLKFDDISILNFLPEEVIVISTGRFAKEVADAAAKLP